MYGLTRRAHSAGSHAGSFVTNWLTKAVWRLFDSAGNLSPLVRSGATTMGWLYDALGVLRPRLHNLVRNSSMQGARAGAPGVLPDRWFSGATGGLSWQVTGVSVEAGMIYTEVRISGTTNAASASVVIFFEQTTGIPAATGQTYTASAFITRVAGSYPAVAQQYIYEFNSSGTQINQQAANLPTSTPGTLQDNRVSITRTLTNSSTAFTGSGIYFQAPTTGTVVDFTIRIGGPQINLGDLQPFQRTGTYNLFRFTEDFSNAAWSKVGTTVSANATAGVDGGLNADKLVEDTSTGGHYVEQDATTAAANTHIIEWDIKAGERFRVNFENYSIPTTSILANIQFNMQTGAFAGALSQNGAQLTPSAQQLANGWWRIRLVVTLGGTNTAIRARCAVINNGTTVYAGDGASGIFINRAQMHPGSVPMPYEPVLGSTPAPAAFFGSRATYDPANLSAGPILAQRPSRTNNVRNNTMRGAVAGILGQGGALPDRWTIFNDGGLQTQVVGTGATNGLPWVELRMFGTTSVTFYVLSFEQVNSTPASAGQVWSEALSAAHVGGTFTNVTGANVNVRFNGGAGNTASVPMSLNSTLRRQPVASATGGTGVTDVVAAFGLAFSGVGVAVDITLRIAVPELSQGDILPWEPPILTFGAAATVGADLNTVRLADIGYNVTESTIYADCFTSDRSSPRVVFDIGDGGAFGTTAYVTLTDTGTKLNPSAAPINMDSTAPVTANSVRVAAALKRNDSVIAANGLLGAVDTNCEVPSNPTTLTIGRGGWSGAANPLNGGVRQLAAIPTRVPNSGVQRLVRT